MTDPVPLGDLRREIDRLDDRLHDLLLQRARLATDVGARKRQKEPVPRWFRPAREARILRRLLGRNGEELPDAALQAIWRNIIGANLAIQGSVRIVASATRLRTAREHFGPMVPVRRLDDSAGALPMIRAGEADVAVLPFPAGDDKRPWWPSLALPSRDPGLPLLHVVARIPMVPNGDDPAALVMAVPPESSGTDRTLVTTRTLSTDLTGGTVLAHDPSGSLFLHDIDGFLPAVPEAMTRIGTYPVLG